MFDVYPEASWVIISVTNFCNMLKLFCLSGSLVVLELLLSGWQSAKLSSIAKGKLSCLEFYGQTK